MPRFVFYPKIRLLFIENRLLHKIRKSDSPARCYSETGKNNCLREAWGRDKAGPVFCNLLTALGSGRAQVCIE
jgi:hypothetical protein